MSLIYLLFTDLSAGYKEYGFKAILTDVVQPTSTWFDDGSSKVASQSERADKYN
jgi:hypothetical protein